MGEGFDLSKLLQALLVFVFFVLPVLKNVAASKAKQREQEPPRPGPRPPKEARPKRGLEEWERLLRGDPPPERPAAAPPVAPPVTPKPAPPPSRRDTRPMPEAGVAPTRRAPIPAEIPAASQRDRISEREGVAGGLGSDASFGRRSLEGAAAAPGGMGVALQPGLSSPGSSLRADLASRSGARPGPLRGALDARAWRRAVIAAELLSPPLALRDRPAWPGGPAMS